MARQQPHESIPLQEVRKTFLRYHCEACSGKVYRCYYEGKMYLDDANGSELYASRICDVCQKCGAEVPGISTEVMRGPISNIDSHFDNFEALHLSRAEFDDDIIRMLEQRGVKWA